MIQKHGPHDTMDFRIFPLNRNGSRRGQYRNSAGVKTTPHIGGIWFFEDPSALRPSKRVERYDITAPLFSDYAEKDRFIYTLEVLDPDTDGILPFQVGSALIKTFRYGTRKVETRVLIHKDTGWVGYPCLWNEDATEAKLKLAGANLRLETSFGMIEYRVPNFNQCGGCQTNAQGRITPIGPRPRHLAKEGQLEHLVQAGVITHVPDVIPTLYYRDNNLPLEQRAQLPRSKLCALPRPRPSRGYVRTLPQPKGRPPSSPWRPHKTRGSRSWIRWVIGGYRSGQTRKIHSLFSDEFD